MAIEIVLDWMGVVLLYDIGVDAMLKKPENHKANEYNFEVTFFSFSIIYSIRPLSTARVL